MALTEGPEFRPTGSAIDPTHSDRTGAAIAPPLAMLRRAEPLGATASNAGRKWIVADQAAIYCRGWCLGLVGGGCDVRLIHARKLVQTAFASNPETFQDDSEGEQTRFPHGRPKQGSLAVWMPLCGLRGSWIWASKPRFQPLAGSEWLDLAEFRRKARNRRRSQSSSP